MKPIKLKFRTVFWAAAALVVVVLLAFAFRPQPVLVDLAKVTQGPMAVTVRDEGRTRVRDVYVVSAPVAGRLLRVENKPGDLVAAGQVVTRILPAEPPFLDVRIQSEAEALVRSAEATLALARAEAARAQAQLNFANAEFSRVETLAARGVLAPAALDRARLELRAAQAGLNTAQAAVRARQSDVQAARARLITPRTPSAPRADGVVEVRAPAAGRILRVLQESESVVVAGAPLLEVGDPGDLEVLVELLSTEAAGVQEGAQARIENWGPGPPLAGRVRRVEPGGFLKVSALGVEEQRVNVLIDLVDPQPAAAALGHGYRVEAAIVVWQAPAVVQAPTAALFRSAGRWAVFKVGDGRARLTPVEVGRDNGQVAQILSGLEPGDAIVLYPGEQVRDGVRVRSRAVGR